MTIGLPARRSITFASETPIDPGASWESAISPRWFVGGETDLRVDLTPETFAHFALERFAPMSLEDMAHYSHGRVLRPGAYLRLRNKSGEARFVRGWAIVTPNVEHVQRGLELAAEEAWSRGGDPDPLDAPPPETFDADLARVLSQRPPSVLQAEQTRDPNAPAGMQPALPALPSETVQG